MIGTPVAKHSPSARTSAAGCRPWVADAFTSAWCRHCESQSHRLKSYDILYYNVLYHAMLYNIRPLTSDTMSLQPEVVQVIGQLCVIHWPIVFKRVSRLPCFGMLSILSLVSSTYKCRTTKADTVAIAFGHGLLGMICKHTTPFPEPRLVAGSLMLSPVPGARTCESLHHIAIPHLQNGDDRANNPLTSLLIFANFPKAAQPYSVGGQSSKFCETVLPHLLLCFQLGKADQKLNRSLNDPCILRFKRPQRSTEPKEGSWWSSWSTGCCSARSTSSIRTPVWSRGANQECDWQV